MSIEKDEPCCSMDDCDSQASTKPCKFREELHIKLIQTKKLPLFSLRDLRNGKLATDEDREKAARRAILAARLNYQHVMGAEL